MTSILLIEDHPLFAEALRRMLNGRGYLEVEMVDTAEKALRTILDLKVDLALVDVALPDMNGIELVSALHQRYPELLCLMLSGYLSPRYVRLSLEAGARGYAIKDSAAGILEGIQQVLDGEIYVSKVLL